MTAIDERALAAAFDILWPAQEWNGEERVCRAATRATITAYLQALRPGSTGETEGWRDIASAGRELKAVLGYQATPGDWEGQMAICWPMGPVDKPAVWIGEGGLMPTHWMPLPSPPSAMLAAAGGRDE